MIKANQLDCELRSCNAYTNKVEGEAVLLEHISINTTKRILALGQGCRLIKLLKKYIPNKRDNRIDASPL
ncbi:MAG: hypothetical protein JO327_08070 [Nitrososphaeraceae archaeon]|nr:hypothetical protein [Nitrososphaeraceae archaeon]MBV9668071.1 hypothetical protein [Nitrososphaeraceae archaeon]